MKGQSRFDFESIDKNNFVSLKLEENILYYGEIKLNFIEQEESSEKSEESKKSLKKETKSKKKGKQIDLEELEEKRDIYSEYKQFEGQILNLENLKEEADLELILADPRIQVIRQGYGTMIQYQINEEMLSKYEGQWEDGEITGSGRVIYPNQGNYSGLFLKGMRQGFGMFEWPSGEKYSGQWVGDCMQGYGVFLTGGESCSKRQTASCSRASSETIIIWSIRISTSTPF